MRIHKNLLHKCVICALNQNPWDVLSSSELSEDLQIIEANDKFCRDGTRQKASWERMRIIPTEPAPSTKKVVKQQRDLRPQIQKTGVKCDDDIYYYYAGYGQKHRKKRRGATERCCTELGMGCIVDKKGDRDDDDEKPLKERSMKSLLAGDISKC
ncbi:uncharacterized protein LOC141689594 [Apium graveolens]|uniref:uncharacterized protein LOC141689594 n=1 Tax=Apium graveolens TaxID=4045 RepID=UPI003D7BD1E0